MVRKSVKVRVEEVIHETDAAYLFLIDGSEYWCPKSQVIEVVSKGDRDVVIGVSEWWMERKSTVNRVALSTVKSSLKIQTLIAEELSRLSVNEAQEVLEQIREFLDEQFGPQDVGEKGGE